MVSQVVYQFWCVQAESGGLISAGTPKEKNPRDRPIAVMRLDLLTTDGFQTIYVEKDPMARIQNMR